MARKACVEKQKRREKQVALKWDKRLALKKKILDPSLTEEEHEKAVADLNKMSPNSSYVRLRNRCQLTGRPRGFLRKFKVSRICFRELASRALIPGVTKSSW